MNGPNKLEHYITLCLKGLPRTNALSYWAHLHVTNKMKGCEYSPKYHTISRFKNAVNYECKCFYTLRIFEKLDEILLDVS